MSGMMDDQTLLELFEGNMRHLEIYKSARSKTDELKHHNDISEEMTEALVGGNSRAVSRKSILKPTEDILYLDDKLYSYSCKQTALDQHENDHEDDSIAEASAACEMDVADVDAFECGQHGCLKTFSCLSAYESHYHSCHHYTCATCRRVFVSSFMLDVHIQENHDSYFQILSSRIDMYQCLVESCNNKFRTPEVRKQHLMSVHKYPASFNFHKPVPVNNPNKEDRTPNANVVNDVNTMDCDIAADVGSDQSRAASGLCLGIKPKMVPTSICFGRGAHRSFQKRSKQKAKNIMNTTENK